MKMHPRISAHSSRRGAVVVLAAFLLVVVFGVMAFVVDIGYLQNTRTELQRSADSAALAAAWELWDDGVLNGSTNTSAMISSARATAAQFAAATAASATTTRRRAGVIVRATPREKIIPGLLVECEGKDHDIPASAAAGRFETRHIVDNRGGGLGRGADVVAAKYLGEKER